MKSLVLLTAAAAAAATLAATTANASTDQPRTLSASVASQVTSLRRGIAWHRSKTHYWQTVAGVPKTPSEHAERRTRSVPFLKWIERTWSQRRIAARKLASRRATYRSQGSAYGSTGWDRVAQCESGGDWSLVTGNGFYWGLQWVPSTWDSRASALGLPSWSWFVDRRSAPSRSMQIQAATGMSLSNWPVCGARY